MLLSFRTTIIIYANDFSIACYLLQTYTIICKSYPPVALPNPDPPKPPEVSNPVLPDCELPPVLDELPPVLVEELPKFIALGSNVPEPEIE